MVVSLILKQNACCTSCFTFVGPIFAGEKRMRGRHVYGRALVAHVDDRNAERGEPIP